MSCKHETAFASDEINSYCSCGVRVITHVLLPDDRAIKLFDYPADHDFAKDGFLPAAVREQLERQA